MISAQIIQAQDWTYAFWWQSLANGIVLLATVAFVPELIYDRSPYNAEVARRRELACPTSDKVSTEDKDAVLASVVAAPASKWSAYRLYTGVKTDEPFWRIAIRPFFYVTSPVVIWATLTFSVCFNLLPLAATVYSQIFSAPPYSLKVGSIGILSGIPPLIGTIIGTVLSGPGSDWIAKAMAKRNNGIYEPEFVRYTRSLRAFACPLPRRLTLTVTAIDHYEPLPGLRWHGLLRVGLANVGVMDCAGRGAFYPTLTAISFRAPRLTRFCSSSPSCTSASALLPSRVSAT